MSVEGGTNKPGWPAPGNVRKLRGKFEEIAKKEAEELVKTKRGEKSVTSRPPTTASIERIKTLGRPAVEMGSGDTILRSSTKAKEELGQGKITKGGSRQSKALGRITQARFQARKEQPSVLKRWPPVTQSSSQVKTSKAESETDKKLRQVSVRVGKLNVEERKRRLNRSLMSEEEFYSACQKSSDELADLFLEMAENPEGQVQVRTQQEKLLKMVQGNTKLEKQIKLQKKVVEGLVKTHSKSELEGGLDRVASSICMSEKYGLSPDDITREARMLGCDEKTAMLKMVRRLTVYLQSEIVDASKQTPSLVKRSEMTGFELSVVRGVDKAFKKQVLGNLPSTVAKLEHQCIAIATKKGVIIEEKVAGTGSFKVATFASDYFSIERPADRVQFVTAKPHKLATDFSALATLRSKGKEETLSGSGTGVVSREPSLSGSVIIHDDEASPSDTSISHGDDEASPSDTFIFHGDD
ncbi:MAG: hypothetical protein ACE5GN_05750, partial [Waddliaceae bacterium]